MYDALGLMVYNDTLTKFAEICYTNDIKICIYLFIMKELQEWLAEMSGPLLNDQFSIYIYIHTFLTPDYWPLLTSLFIFTHFTKKSILL